MMESLLAFKRAGCDGVGVDDVAPSQEQIFGERVEHALLHGDCEHGVAPWCRSSR